MSKRFRTKRFRLREGGGRGAVIVAINALPQEGDYDVILREHKSDRSLAQNNLMWMWLTIIAREYAQARDEAKDWYSPEEWKEEFQEKFLGYKAVRMPSGTKNRLIGTSELTTRQFTAFLEDMEHYCGSVLNITLPHPEDVYYEALRKMA